MNINSKDNFKEILSKTRKQFNEWDPLGLIKNGAPEDEYDRYTYKLISCMEGNKSIDETSKIIAKELSNMFSTDITPDDCSAFINKIMPLKSIN